MSLCHDYPIPDYVDPDTGSINVLQLLMLLLDFILTGLLNCVKL
jgi:hypothetical protein